MNVKLNTDHSKRSNFKQCRDKCFSKMMINEELHNLLKLADVSERLILLKDFVNKIKTQRYIQALKRFMYTLCFIFVIACILKSGPLDKWFSWMFRITSIKLLSRIDWTQIRNTRCLVANPTIPTRVFDLTDCDQCENIDGVMHVNQIDGSNFMTLLKQDIPVVVTQTGKDTPQTFESVVEFVDLFLSVDDLGLYEPCGFASNLKRKVDDHRQLLQLINTGDVLSFYAHWENCAEISYKSFRRFYERPEFLPANIQLTESNWAMICSHYQGKRPKSIERHSPLYIMMVLKGHVDIKISPWSICNTTCSEITERLYAGGVLLLTDTLWQLEYTPSCKDGDTIVIGINGYFD